MNTKNKKFNADKLINNTAVEDKKSQTSEKFKISKEYSCLINKIKDNNSFYLKNNNKSIPFTYNNNKRKKKIPPVPDFYGNIEYTVREKNSRDLSNNINYYNLNIKNDKFQKKIFYSNDFGGIISITKYNNNINLDKKNNSNSIESNINLNHKIYQKNKKYESNNDIKTDTKPINNIKNNLNNDPHKIKNDNNENKSSINKNSISKLKKHDVLNKSNELLYTYNNNKNNNDAKDNINSSNVISNKSNTNFILNEINLGPKNNNKFIGKKRKIIKIKYSTNKK